MPHATTRRTERPRSLGPVTLLEFEALDRTHADVVQALRQLERLMDRIDAVGLDPDSRAASAALCEFFDGTARAHHEDEERVVFPPLLSGGDATLIEHVRRLQQDHGWLEEDWRELRPALSAIADGIEFCDAASLRRMAAVFSTLYIEHIALEEALIYPASKHCLLAIEIAQRRRATASA